MRRQDIQREEKKGKKPYAMRIPHWWSRDRSSCRHLWYPITGLRRNTPRIVHLLALVLENGASSLTRARVSARTLDFRVHAKVVVNTGFDDLRQRFASIRGVNERSIATTTGCSTQAIYLLYEQKNAEWPRNRSLKYCPRSLSTAFTANLCTVRYTDQSARTTRQKVHPSTRDARLEFIFSKS